MAASQTFLLLLLAASPAKAETAPPDHTMPRFSLRADAYVAAGDVDGNYFREIGSNIGIDAYIHPRIILRMGFSVGTLAFDYSKRFDQATRANAQLSLAGMTSVRGGLRFILLKTRRLTLESNITYQRSVFNNSLEMDKINLETDGQNLDLTSYLRQHSEFTYVWYRFSMGAAARLHFGRWAVRIGAGFERYAAQVRLRFDAQSEELLKWLTGNPDTVVGRHDIVYNTPYFEPGVEIDLSKRLKLEIAGAAVPLPEGSWALGANAGLIVNFY